MLVVLTTNLVLNLVFYYNFNDLDLNKGEATFYQDAYNQERLVSITTYLHTAVEVIFNIVMLIYLIAIAADQDDDEPSIEPPTD